MQRFKTVLGDIPEEAVGITLCHEHIGCYSEYLYQMTQGRYLDKQGLITTAAAYLRRMKEQHGLTTFIDCTPLHIGRDIAVLREVSRRSGVNIVCSTGFYYTEETLFCNLPAETIADSIICDARGVNAGLIKCAVEGEQFSAFDRKILEAAAQAQRILGLPIILHTNAHNQNGLKALELLMEEGVKPGAITVGHLSDSEDLDYVKEIARHGCFIGLDRLYPIFEEEYIAKKIHSVLFLCENGYGDRVLLSHDDAFFNGFVTKPAINSTPRFSYCFDHILPKLPESIVQEIMIKNPIKMLKCGD